MSRWFDENVEFLGKLPKKYLKGDGERVARFAEKWKSKRMSAFDEIIAKDSNKSKTVVIAWEKCKSLSEIMKETNKRLQK